MIEKIIISYLGGVLSVPVYAEMPSDPPKEFVVIQKMSGGVTNMVNAATISFESYSTSLQKSAELDEEVQKAVLESNSIDEISGVKLGGESSNIDTQNKKYCYESIFNFYYYK